MEFELSRLGLEWCSPHTGRTVCAKGLCFSKQQRTGLFTSRQNSCYHIKSFPTQTTVLPYEEFWRGQHSPSCFIWKTPFMVLTNDFRANTLRMNGQKWRTSAHCMEWPGSITTRRSVGSYFHRSNPFLKKRRKKRKAMTRSSRFICCIWWLSVTE